MADSRPCSIAGCTRRLRARGLCSMHYERQRVHGDPGVPEPLTARGTGRSVTTDGYVRLYQPGHPIAAADGWALEHRVVAYDAGMITADDPRGVHHRNHVRTDNRPENLRPMTSAEHAREHGRSRLLDPTRMIELRRAGWSTPRIAAEVGKNCGTVWRVLKRNGAL